MNQNFSAKAFARQVACWVGLTLCASLAHTSAMAQDLGLGEFSDQDTRGFIFGGITSRNSTNASTYNYNIAYKPKSNFNFAIGIEQDFLLGFGLGLKATGTNASIDYLTETVSSGFFSTTATSYDLSDGNWKAVSIIPSLHYRVENDVLEPYASFGVGLGTYTFDGSWNGTKKSETDYGVTYDFAMGLDYLTQSGMTAGLMYNFQAYDGDTITKGGSAHTLGIRIGFEVQNTLF